MATVQSGARTKSPPAPSSFHASVSPPLQPLNSSYHDSLSTSPPDERSSFDSKVLPPPAAAAFGDGSRNLFPCIALRNLPPSMSPEALNSMLIFAEDFVDTWFVDGADVHGFHSAIARFKTPQGAQEAKDRLHGKMNSTGDAQLQVDVLPQSNTIFGQASGLGQFDGSFTGLTRHVSNPASLRRAGSNARQSSRYFQSMGEKLGPIKIPPNTMENGFVADSDSFFSQLSPRGPSFGDGQRVTGKSVISEDADDETGELLRDPVAYAKNDRSNSIKRSNSSAHPPVSRMAGLSLNTGGPSSNGSSVISTMGGAFGASRPIQSFGSPTAEMSPPGPGSPTGGVFPLSPSQLQRHNYPPANPADQNPPCNTLYVGNLPIDTSEDELKAIFSKQRGYKRLCFRTKHNGPMCFVEFEDVSFATKALNDLYGQPLHNSVKGGIRLSFSKNPLGVRTGQANSMNPTSPLSSPNGGPGIGVPPGFATANGPPPGLSAPPGLSSPSSGMGSGSSGGFASFFGPASPPLAQNPGQQTARGPQTAQMGSNNFTSFSGNLFDGTMSR